MKNFFKQKDWGLLLFLWVQVLLAFSIPVVITYIIYGVVSAILATIAIIAAVITGWFAGNH